MKRSTVPVEDIYRLLPDFEELDILRLSIMGTAVPDPGKEWASSSAYTTVDKRVVTLAGVEKTLDGAEAALQEYFASLFGAFRQLFRSFWAGNYAESASLLIEMGETERERGQTLRARRFFETALSLSLPLSDKQLQILVLRRTARVLAEQGDLKEALLYYNRSAELASATGDLRGEVVARTGAGNVLLYQGRWGEAEERYRNVLARIDSEPDVQAFALEMGQVYNNLGTATTRQRRFSEAEEWFVRALEVWSGRESPVDLAICLHNKGLLRREQGRGEEARKAMWEALALPITPGLRAIIATDLAESFARDGWLSQADEWGREAEQHAITACSPYSLSHMYCGLGNIARLRGDEGGVTFFEKALEIARAREYPLSEGEALLDYALLRIQIGEEEEAVSYLRRAHDIFSSLGADHERERVETVLKEISATDEPPVAAE